MQIKELQFKYYQAQEESQLKEEILKVTSEKVIAFQMRLNELDLGKGRKQFTK